MAYFKNKNFIKRDYECTNVVACESDTSPKDYFVESDVSAIDGLTHIYTQGGVKYYGYL